MIELLVVVLKALVILIVCSIILSIKLAFEIYDHPNPRARKHGMKLEAQLAVMIFIMVVLSIFVCGIINYLGGI